MRPMGRFANHAISAGMRNTQIGNVLMAVAPNRDEELAIFVEHMMDFMNMWTIYNDFLTGKYVPTVDAGVDRTKMHATLMFAVYSYFYVLIDDHKKGLDAFHIWRDHFPKEEKAIAAIEAQIKPLRKDLKEFRNRLGFHGSRSRAHEAAGFDLFANADGGSVWNAIKNFKAMGASLLALDMAQKNSDEAEIKRYQGWIDKIAERARQQASGSTSPPTLSTNP